MTLTNLETGEAIKIQGLACVYQQPSSPFSMYGGRAEVVLPGAFDSVLAMQSRDVVIQILHEGDNYVLASRHAGNLRLWCTEAGLCFDAGPFPIDERTAAAVAWVKSRQFGGCSIKATARPPEHGDFQGVPSAFVQQFQSLEHIALVPDGGGAYPGARAWTSDQHPGDLPAAVMPIAWHWHQHRQTPVPPMTAAERRALKARAVASKTARTRAAAARHVSPAPAGFTQSEWDDFGRREAVARRAMARGWR